MSLEVMGQFIIILNDVSTAVDLFEKRWAYRPILYLGMANASLTQIGNSVPTMHDRNDFELNDRVAYDAQYCVN